jgi:hypothetical protein
LRPDLFVDAVVIPMAGGVLHDAIHPHSDEGFEEGQAVTRVALSTSRTPPRTL